MINANVRARHALGESRLIADRQRILFGYTYASVRTLCPFLGFDAEASIRLGLVAKTQDTSVYCPYENAVLL